MRFLLTIFILFATTLALADPPAPTPKSFTFWAYVHPNSTSDFTVSVPWSDTMAVYNATCGGTCADVGHGEPLPAGCFYITRVFAQNSNGFPIMVGKTDAAGYGGDYITPGQTPGASDSGWFPQELRPLFKPPDEIHAHTSGPNSLVRVTIFYLPTNC